MSSRQPPANQALVANLQVWTAHLTYSFFAPIHRAMLLSALAALRSLQRELQLVSAAQTRSIAITSSLQRFAPGPSPIARPLLGEVFSA